MFPVNRILDTDEQEIWRRGPVVVYNEWCSLSQGSKIKFAFGIKKAANWKKVHYVLTNKRALVLEADKDSRIMAQCNLSKCEISIANMPGNYASMNFGAQQFTPTGDMIFLQKGNTILKFLKVQDPESVVTLIKTVLRKSH